MSRPRVLGVIPARIGSTRLARKPLVPIQGRPLVQWVHEAAARARGLDELVVATDDRDVFDTVAGFGGTAVMTRADHESGTDRVAEVARAREWAELIVNIQGDEPLLPAAYIESGLAPFGGADGVRMATLATPITDEAELADSGVAKVVADRRGNALYFSRTPIPYDRGDAPERWRQIGIYFFAREALLQFVSWPRSPLERAEGLEQLRALENGLPIRVVPVPAATPHVDTERDVARVEELLQGR